MADTPTSEHYWFNTKSGQVEKGPQSSWENRMGPYDTEAEARRRARHRRIQVRSVGARGREVGGRLSRWRR